jgi:hypothetical protein
VHLRPDIAHVDLIDMGGSGSNGGSPVVTMVVNLYLVMVIHDLDDDGGTPILGNLDIIVQYCKL